MDTLAPALRDAVARAMPFSKATPERVAAMAMACSIADDLEIPGAVVETGVFLGANIIAARVASPSRVCWLYDTFDGMTEPGEFDIRRDGSRALEKYRRKKTGTWMAASLDECRAALAAAGVYDPALCKFVVGPVERTLQRSENLPKEIAVLRLDTDWHSSTKVALQQLWPRLRSRGTLLVDDYGHWLGCRQAVDEYFSDRAEEVSARAMVDYTCLRILKR